MNPPAGSVVRPASALSEQEPESRVRVVVWAADPITLNGLTQTLTGSLDVFVTTGELPAEVDVLVFAADRVTSEVMARMRRTAAQTTAPMVLVTSELDRSHLLGAVECRVVAVLHRSAATEERLISTIAIAARGGGMLPPNLLGDLLRQVQNLHEEVLTPRGLNSAGFNSREIDVVRLLAEGCDTEEIGNRLCYSERTVKNIIHALTSRLDLRNRPQLVAYGLRAGII
ncbi:response regulator transcription factor [Saccharopolyspora sp. MS10]|uniref:helix-turn-helix transcriptional regulator n=1 Tax=Saccharopolyspora sp. MS10 TaxID=3385973 RepID=UPI0039A1CD8F